VNLEINDKQDSISRDQTRIAIVDKEISDMAQWYNVHNKEYHCRICDNDFNHSDIVNPTIELYQICPKCKHKSGLPTRIDIRNL